MTQLTGWQDFQPNAQSRRANTYFNANTTATAAGHAIGPFTTAVAFDTLEIYLGGPAGSYCGVLVANTTTGASAGPQTVLFGTYNGPLHIPLPCNQGDTFQVTLFSLDAPVFTVACVIPGLGSVFQPYALRADGRRIMAGGQVITANLGVGAVNLIAPTSPACVMIHSVSLGTTGAGLTSVGFTVDGVVTRFPVIEGPGNALWQPPQGMLCDPGTAVSASNAVGAAPVSINYDIVL